TLPILAPFLSPVVRGSNHDEFSGTNGRPWGVPGDDGVGQDDELSGHGDGGAQVAFAVGAQALVEGLEIGVPSGSAEGAHEDALAQAGAAALHMPPSLGLAGVVVEGGGADQRGGRLAADAAHLR